MYPTSGATIRADLNILVEEASLAEKMLIGLQVLPPLPVDARAGTYPKLVIAGGALSDALATERARGGSYGNVNRKWGTDNYDCVDRGLEEPVDDTDVSDMRRFFNLESVAARLTLRNVLKAHEARVAAAVINTATFAETNPAVDYTAANLATIDFVSDLLAAIDRVEDNETYANTVVIPKAVFSRLVQSKILKEFVRGTADGNVSMPINAENIAKAFADYGIERVLIGRARVNTGKKGAAKSMAQVWPNTHIWVGRTNPAAKEANEGGAGFTLYWTAEGGIYTTETYRSEEKRSNMVRVRQNTAEKIVDPTAGTLIKTNYA